MSTHRSEPAEGTIESHPVKATIVVLIGLFAMVAGLMLLAHLATGLYGARSLKGSPAMSPERVAERIAPVAKVNVAPASPAPTQQGAAPAPQGTAPAQKAEPGKVASAAPSAPPAAAPAAANGGKAVFDSTCTACHTAGLVGAPKFGDKAAWAPRIAQGKPALYNSALHGKNAMPPKGGNANLSEAEVKSAVDYMVAAAK
jgi:cytochrome c5